MNEEERICMKFATFLRNNYSLTKSGKFIHLGDFYKNGPFPTIKQLYEDYKRWENNEGQRLYPSARKANELSR